MIDIHTHLLPGVDDGSPSIEVTLPVLRRFAGEGVEVVVCTPHLEASRAASAPHEQHLEILRELAASAPPVPRLVSGWEIMLDIPRADLRVPQLSLGGSTAVLVEFPRTHVPLGAAEELSRLRASGVVPVLAHPERYWGCTPAVIRTWRNAGAVIQMDAAALLGQAAMARLSRAMLEQGLVDCIASDNHGDGRTLAAARDWLEEIGAAEQAQLLTRYNPERLLASEPVLPVQGIELRRGVLGRLKELVLGK